MWGAGGGRCLLPARVRKVKRGSLCETEGGGISKLIVWKRNLTYGRVKEA